MSGRHRAQRPRLFWWQRRHALIHRLHALRLEIRDELDDLPVILAELKERRTR